MAHTASSADDNSLSGVISYLFMLCLSHLNVLDN